MAPVFQRTFAKTVPDYLPVAKEVESFCAEQDLPQAVTYKVGLVVEELILNLIDHAVGSATNRIDLRIEVVPERVTVILEDDCEPFDPRAAPAFDETKPLEERGPRGMGIHLVRTMTQNLTYERAGSRNRLKVEIKR
jgi:anti-sigma regulatory factor (Ser/Thr protein kinase)